MLANPFDGEEFGGEFEVRALRRRIPAVGVHAAAEEPSSKTPRQRGARGCQSIAIGVQENVEVGQGKADSRSGNGSAKRALKQFSPRDELTHEGPSLSAQSSAGIEFPAVALWKPSAFTISRIR